MTADYAQLFWSKVDSSDPDDCWLWTASTMQSFGHGQFWSWRKGRAARGRMKRNAVLFEEQVRAIRDRVAAGAKQKHLAAEFGVSTSLIRGVVNRNRWRHVT